jgi:hypothetical protein
VAALGVLAHPPEGGDAVTAGSPENPFDFSVLELPDDVVLRLTDEITGAYVDILVTPSGRRAIWFYEGFADFEEALAWAKANA